MLCTGLSKPEKGSYRSDMRVIDALNKTPADQESSKSKCRIQCHLPGLYLSRMNINHCVKEAAQMTVVSNVTCLLSLQQNRF